MAVTAAIGFFDGVHLGHRKVLEQVCSIAHSRGEESLAITFWPHPAEVLGSDAVDLLTTPERRRQLILECGISRVEVLKFTKELASLTAKEFVQEYLIGRYCVASLVLGYDNRFGSDRFESVEELAEVVRSCGIETAIVEPYRLDDGTLVSSTAIRKAIASGREDLAEAMGYSNTLTSK